MNIAILCQFDINSASGRQMAGHAQGASELGHNVDLIIHPFKYEDSKDDIINLNSVYSANYVYSKFFKTNGKRKLFHLFSFLLKDMPKVLFKLLKKDAVTIYKPLPLGWFYALLLKCFFFKGKIMLIADDWEGVGGFASVRSANSVVAKTLITFCEESAPYLCDHIQCASKILHQRFNLTPSFQSKTFYLPMGCRELDLPPPVYKDEQIIVGYVGTFKSRILVDFLLGIIEKTIVRKPPIKFVFLGKGSEFDYLKTQAMKLRLESHLKLTGFVTEKEKLNYLSSFHIALLYLNNQYPETYIDQSRSSTKLFEYMSAGKVILASRFGEPVELLVHRKTAIFSKNTPSDFAQNIIEAAQNRGELEQIAINVKKLFHRNYSHSRLMQEQNRRWFI